MHDEPTPADRSDAGGSGASRGTSEEEELLTERIAPKHRIADFRCSRSPRIQGFFLNEYPYFTRTNYTRVFVYAETADPDRILGYYTLSAAAIARRSLAGKYQRPKKTPPGIDPPMVRIGFLGRDDDSTKGLGGALVRDAAIRISKLDVGAWGIVLDADNEALANAFYLKLGFHFAEGNDPSIPKLLMYAPLASLLG